MIKIILEWPHHDLAIHFGYGIIVTLGGLGMIASAIIYPCSNWLGLNHLRTIARLARSLIFISLVAFGFFMIGVFSIASYVSGGIFVFFGTGIVVAIIGGLLMAMNSENLFVHIMLSGIISGFLLSFTFIGIGEALLPSRYSDVPSGSVFLTCIAIITFLVGVLGIIGMIDSLKKAIPYDGF